MLRLQVPISGPAATHALDRLLAVAPLGVHEQPGALVIHADELPSVEDMRAALGVSDLRVEVVPESAADRLAEIARPEPVDGRLLVRADWMAPIDGMQEVVLADASAFGTGGHPTTRDCLSTLMSIEPGGAFADLGCGAGVLAIAAAKLGWGPVHAVDVAARAVEATRANAAANGVAIDVSEADLTTVAPPSARTVAANVPVAVHAAIATSWAEPPDHLIVSGVHLDERAKVIEAYGAEVLEERTAGPWLTLLLRPGAPPAYVRSAEIDPRAADAPPADGDRIVELGARAALFDLPGEVRFDVWALDDSLRWALRGPAGTSMEIEEETRLSTGDDGDGRPPSTVRIVVRVTTPSVSTRATLHVTVATAEPGLVRIGGSAVAEVAGES